MAEFKRLDRLQSLIERLIAMSEGGGVPWTETATDSAFQASLNQYTVTIEHEYRGDKWGKDVYGYVFRVHDNEGKLLDDVRESDFLTGTPFASPTGPKSAEDAIRELYELKV